MKLLSSGFRLYGFILLLGAAVGFLIPHVANLTQGNPRLFYTACILLGVLFSALLLEVVQRIILQPLKDFSRALEQVSKGNLNVIIRGSQTGDFQVLADHFHLMLNYFKTSVSQLKKSSDETLHLAHQLSQTIQQMHGATEEVSSTIQNISKGAEEQASKVQEAFNIIDKMAGS